MTEETVHEEEAPRKRRGIASFFQQIADRLRRGEKVAVDDEQSVTVEVPAETELEIELEWDEKEGAIETDVVASKARFELFEDSAGEYRWRLVHRNSNIIADSGEGYASKQKAEQGLESVRENAPAAYVVDLSNDEAAPEDGGSDAAFELFEDDAGDWRWRLRHDNGNIIADGGQGYSSKQKTKQGLASVRNNVPGAPVEDAE